MNLKKTNNYPTIDERFPKALGSFDEQLRYSLRFHHWLEGANDNFLHVYNTGWNSGYGKGTEDGIVAGVKNYIVSGADQAFVDKVTGTVYPFSSMDEIAKDPHTVPRIKKFLYQQANQKLPDLEKKYNEVLPEVSKLKEEIANEAWESEGKKTVMMYDDIPNEEFLDSLGDIHKEIVQDAREIGIKKLKDVKLIKAKNKEIIEDLDKEIFELDENLTNVMHNAHHEIGELKKKYDKIQERVNEYSTLYEKATREKKDAKARKIERNMEKKNEKMKEIYEEIKTKNDMTDTLIQEIENKKTRKIKASNLQKTLERYDKLFDAREKKRDYMNMN